MAFYRKATGSPTTASPNLMVHSPSLGGFPTPAKGRSTGSWWLSRRLTPTASTILTHLSMCVSPAFNGSRIQIDSILLRFLQRLCTNAVMWKRLRHPNVVGFLGFDSESPPFSLVYPWMSDGSLSDWLRDHPHADKLGLVCCCFRQDFQRFGRS